MDPKTDWRAKYREILNENKRLHSQIYNLRGALAWIWNSTEPTAIKFRNYDHLAGNIADVAKAGLDGDFVDDMHAAEVYDQLHSRADVGSSLEPSK